MSEEDRGAAGKGILGISVAAIGLSVACLPNCLGNRSERSAKFTSSLEDCCNRLSSEGSFILKEVPNGIDPDTYNIYAGNSLLGRVSWESPNYVIWAGDNKQKIGQFTRKDDVFSGYDRDNVYFGKMVVNKKSHQVEMYDSGGNKLAFINDSRLKSNVSVPIYSALGKEEGVLEKLGYADNYRVSGTVDSRFLFCLTAFEDSRLDGQQTEAVLDVASHVADD